VTSLNTEDSRGQLRQQPQFLSRPGVALLLHLIDDGNDESLRFKQYTPRETVLRELLRRSLTEVRRVVKNVEELGFEIKGGT